MMFWWKAPPILKPGRRTAKKEGPITAWSKSGSSAAARKFPEAAKKHPLGKRMIFRFRLTSLTVSGKYMELKVIPRTYNVGWDTLSRVLKNLLLASLKCGTTAV
jgi:hypothetical protein